jgi:hypothetical protein
VAGLDDYSTLMSASFTDKPRYQPYLALRPTYPMTTINRADARMTSISAKQGLTNEDEIDEKTFSEAIPKSVHGPTP